MSKVNSSNSSNSSDKIMVFRNGEFVLEERPNNPMGIVVFSINCTPAMAKTLLKKNGRNRSINKSNVNALLNDIMDDQWFPNGDAISFYDTGDVAEGQHRLKAIVISGKTVPILVVFGLKAETAIGMGSGKSRNSRAIAKINGENLPAAAIGMTGFYLQIESKRSKISQRQKQEFYKANKEHVDFVLDAFETHRDGNKYIPGIYVGYVQAALMAAHAAKVSNSNLDDFIRVLVTGIPKNGKREEIVIKQLRDFIMSNSHMSQGGQPRIDMYKRVQKVLKNFIDNNTKRFRKSDEIFYSVDKDSLPNIQTISWSKEK